MQVIHELLLNIFYRILWRIIIINTMFTIPTAIFFEAFLSFIGLGLQAPDASLGTLINDGYKLIQYPTAYFIISIYYY